MSDRVLVIGGGIAGIQAALDLADAGARVVLVERQATIGGIMAVLDKNFPTLDCSICIEAPSICIPTSRSCRWPKSCRLKGKPAASGSASVSGHAS